MGYKSINTTHHADSEGIFADAEVVNTIQADGQMICYCLVNNHHQKGKEVKKMSDLQEMATTMVLHAKQRWPEAVATSLSPYAVRMVNDISNFCPGIDDGILLIDLFPEGAVTPLVKHSHTLALQSLYWTSDCSHVK
jgi:hypothetical protein